jgi:hypothetical protein
LSKLFDLSYISVSIFFRKSSLTFTSDPMPVSQPMSEAEALRRERKARAEAAKDLERDSLAKHLSRVDQRLEQRALEKEASLKKRQHENFDPTPKLRPMYDDHRLASAAQIPGPGTYTPRSKAIGEFGTTFAKSDFSPEMTHDRGAGSPDRWKLRNAMNEPSPASYNTAPRRGVAGTTFGLPPELLSGRVVPDAHNMMQTVAYLAEIPGPGAHSPRNMNQKKNACRWVPGKTYSGLELAIAQSAKVPGPGTYEPSKGSNRSTVLGKDGGKSLIESIQEQSAWVPGPGAYQHHTQLRSRGSPRFGRGGGTKSLIEQVMAEAKHTPGPAAYPAVAPTVKQEIEKKKRLDALIKDSGAA